MLFFYSRIIWMKQLYVTRSCRSNARTFRSFFSMKLIIPFPKFLGMFFVSFLPRETRTSSCFSEISSDGDSGAASIWMAG